MSIRKITVAALAAATTATITAAVPQVTSVAMSQASGGRTVTISYTLADAPAVVTLEVQTNANTSAAEEDPGWTSIGGAAVCNATGDVWKKVQAGNRTITWRPDLSWPDHIVPNGGARAKVTAWALDNTPNYMVVDVSAAAQPNTQKYYPAADFLPGGVANNLYKTTTLLMRKIMAKDVTWTMGSTTLETKRTATREATHQVTLTNNYYIGVYEITQSQWSEVATNSAAIANFTAERSMRPMELVAYNEIRNTHSTSSSATSVAAGTVGVDPSSDSFLGLLRLKAGIDFDLPSEAQWEFAARAGHGSGCWGDGTEIGNGDTDDNLGNLGRYAKNNPSGTDATSTLTPSSGGTDIVGSHGQNDWGLYDMHGNVWEWCLDWYQDNIGSLNGYVNIDPLNPSCFLSGTVASGSLEKRVRRGGSWNDVAGNCRPAFRNGNYPSTRNNGFGFRVCCTAGLK